MKQLMPRQPTSSAEVKRVAPRTSEKVTTGSPREQMKTGLRGGSSMDPARATPALKPEAGATFKSRGAPMLSRTSKKGPTP